ncbi:MAG: hypothetical protein L0H64_22500, partial [Pseudonocardia sp.]|nr:hypothetical protein [Pseudonocardia sp.]
TNLQRVVDDAWARLEQEWRGTEVLVLDVLTPFGRYDGGAALLNRLLGAARRAGREAGPRVVVLLCAALDEREAPRIGAEAVGLETFEEWIVAPSSWASSASVA